MMYLNIIIHTLFFIRIKQENIDIKILHYLSKLVITGMKEKFDKNPLMT